MSLLNFEEIKKKFAQVEDLEPIGKELYDWPHEAMQAAFGEIEKLSGPPRNYEDAISRLLVLLDWFRDSGRAHYIALDTGKFNEDQTPITMISHSLHKTEQFDALHSFVTQSHKNKLLEENENGS